MKKVFLSYSSGYEHLKDPIRRLLEVFEFSVDIFDGPEFDAVPEVVIQKIRDADAVVVLYGPRERPSASQSPCEPARWPYEEAILARGMQKPVALILHQFVRLPETLTSYATHAKFDFWDPESFLKNVHHIVKYILDFKRRIDLIVPSNQLFHYKKAVRRKRILTPDQIRMEVYHEVVARHPCRTFHHFIDFGGDGTISMPPPDQIRHQLHKRVGNESLQVSMRYGRHDPHEIEYFVEVSPNLEPGQELGYWRSFYLPNPFPLSLQDALQRAAQPGYPRVYAPGEYGDRWDVLFEIDSIAFMVHFPWEVKISNVGVHVLHLKTQESNSVEATRCEPQVKFSESPDDSEKVLELTIPNPLINHSYFLTYRLKD